ncbi:MAG: FAD-binding protein [Promethearchaeota archaeon]
MDSDKSVIVIGGGIAGLQAAIELADCNINVFLIEKLAHAGGNVQKLYKIFPTDDCSFCIGSTLLKSGIRKCFYRAGIKEHPRINLLINCEVKEINGSAGNFEVEIMQYPRYVNNNCTRCGKCEEVCPIEIESSRWNETTRKAIYLPAQQCIPQTYIISRENCPSECRECLEVCPFEGVINLDEHPKELKLKANAIILATGIKEFNPSPLIHLKYGIYENIITQMELAQMLDPNGSTGGKVIRPSDKKRVKSLIMIQCVGSRDVTFHNYCSTICCSYACKHARIIKTERDSSCQIYVIYMDMRTFGVLEKYYRECREAGINFLRGQVAEILEEQDGSMKVLLVDTLIQRSFDMNVDLVVLTPALIPSNEIFELMKKKGVEIDSYGFIQSQIRDITKTNIEGIFTCGTAIAPTDFPSSITLAKSAVFNVLKYIYGVDPS